MKPRKTEGKIRTRTVTGGPGFGACGLGGKWIKNRYIQGEGWRLQGILGANKFIMGDPGWRLGISEL